MVIIEAGMETGQSKKQKQNTKTKLKEKKKTEFKQNLDFVLCQLCVQTRRTLHVSELLTAPSVLTCQRKSCDCRACESRGIWFMGGS